MSQKQALLDVHQALQKSFQVVQQQERVWADTLAVCTPLLSSLSNLAEQLQACKSLTFSNTAFRDFPDLESRLKYKLNRATGTVLEKLGEQMNILRKVRDTTSNQVAACFQTYEQHADSIGLTLAVERSALSPSVADMLEWLQDIERLYRNQYLSRRLLLQSISAENLTDIHALSQSWGRVSEQGDPDVVPDILLKASFFMETRQDSKYCKDYESEL
ncbi:uncharacterized protein C1orf109 homolog [Callorhinchus milii]|uniref:uncharacterized protein C1orf109 homolog n=1 Tax=Callorhinchus milii TaxID=7868 RepID=UPI001C3FE417|nr:uncharacterized protein C1orf109 homolog [Callorhinchus milii]XP_007893145.2 uncharacterized protein C1orf109 homolog [Callorhinchus milii]